ncbi:energy transducer TonB [Parabacteroides sp. FAFU027]|uniref:energy transducer TonB n=1 Tax=Parabacteroides sp. FAFU027 TaxID=2922715 RepID=UPI001FAF220A|nr:energy transducer TonB [Parabacteroides sp. FAFU027]
MAKRIQLHTFHLLFRLFSYLADKPGGWSMFVKPKLVIGSLIVGIGFTSCDVKTRNKPSSSEKDKQDSFQKMAEQKKSNEESTTTCYFTVNSSEGGNINTPVFDEKGQYYIVDQMPEFTGGTDALLKFIKKHIIYPSSVIKEGIEGVVICSFIINTDGSTRNIQVIRGLNPKLDNEAIRVIKLFPKWKPGKQGGKIVPVKFTLPILFTIPEKKN